MHENLTEEELKAINKVNETIDKIEQSIRSNNVFDIFTVHRIFPKDFYEFHKITDITVYGLHYTSADTVDDKLVSELTDFENIHDFANNILWCLSRRNIIDITLPVIDTHCNYELKRAFCHNLPQNMIVNTTTSTYHVTYEPVDRSDTQFVVDWKKIKSFKNENAYDNMLYQRVEIIANPCYTESRTIYKTLRADGDNIEYSKQYTKYTGTVVGYDNTFIILQYTGGTKSFIRIKDIKNIEVLTHY